MQSDARALTRQRTMQIGAWLLAGVVTLLASLAWAQVRLGSGEITAYDIFPLLGLLAFSLMWTHYITGSARRLLRLEPSTLRNFFKITSSVVLILLLLHPSIFLAQLWVDGFGLPPFSYLQVYDGGLERIAIVLGTLGLFAFLLFEFHRIFKDKSWWRYVEYINLAAMAAIFYHALTLGGELDLMWFKVIWFVYGISLVVAVVINKLIKKRGKQ